MNRLLRMLTAGVALCASVFAAEFLQPQLEDKTDAMSRLSCHIQTVNWDGNDAEITGTVYNRSSELSANNVEVEVILIDAQGETINRQMIQVSPAEMLPNANGTFTSSVSCMGRKPAKIVYRVSGI
jgi:transcriptional regulator of aromatic amino acid metabolism